LINYLIQTKNYDSDLVEQYVIGFEKIAAYASRFTQQYVQEQTGIYAHVVEAIAKLIIEHRPNISIFPGAGLEHHENGVNNVRTLAILSCLAGALEQPCGLFRPEPLGIRKLSLAQNVSNDKKPIGSNQFPVLYDIRKECHTMLAMNYMLGQGEYPLKGLIIAAANPAVTNPNTAKVEKALKSLGLLVVNDFFMTKTARLAHYILPAATFLEREEMHFYPKLQMVNITRRLATVDGVLDEYRIWRELALRLGFGGRYFPWKNDTAVNKWLLEPTGLTVGLLQNYPQGYVYKPIRYQKHLSEDLPTLSGKLEFASSYLKQIGLDEIPIYRPPYHRRQTDDRFPFVMTTGARKSLLYHSRNQNIPRFRKLHPEAEMEMHPEDAALIQITDGEKVRVISEIGQLTICVSIKHRSELRRGIVEIYHGWEDWRVNFLTYDEINDPISGFPLLKGEPVRIEKINR